MLDHQPHIVGETNHGIRMTEPKTLRKTAHEIRRAIRHLGGSRHSLGSFVNLANASHPHESMASPAH
jgi:hypothetical protein